jgi:hypothetical protein
MTEQTAPVFCARCGKECIPNEFTTGYGEMQDGTKHCYECCALGDLEIMQDTGKHSGLYLTRGDKGQWYVTNWPGSLRFGPVNVRQGRHNIAGSRRDTWFGYAGYVWHGVSLGDWNDICRVKRTKETTSRNQLVKPA